MTSFRLREATTAYACVAATVPVYCFCAVNTVNSIAIAVAGMTALEVVQDIIAPFLLENLNCTGDEARLVDCPVSTDVSYDTYYTPFEDPYYFTYTQPRDIPLFCNFIEGTFAFVACGAESGPGVPLPL